MAFTSQPPEILDMIVRQISYRDDLSNLSQTCKTLKSHVFPKLYSHVELKVPQTFNVLSHIEALIDSSGEGLQHTTSVTVATEVSNVEYLDNARSVLGATSPESSCGDISIPHPMASSFLNALVRMLLKVLPAQRLSGFSWEHGCFMTATTFEVLLQRQVPSLKKLRIDNFENDADDFCWPDGCGLESLTFHTVGRFSSFEFFEILADDSNTLRHLCLGSEALALQSYHGSQGRTSMDEQFLSEVVGYLEEDSEKDDEPWLNLGALEMKSLDLSTIIKTGSLFLNLQCLTSLSLQSCYGLEGAFDFLANGKTNDGRLLSKSLKLQSFSLRHEGSNPQLKAKLLGFLRSIQGLTHLAILMDNTPQNETLDIGQVLDAHGKTLRSLVWDERRGKRDPFTPSQETSLPGHGQLRQIGRKCEQLIELGISIDWRSLGTNITSPSCGVYNLEATKAAFTPLKHLQVFNIRSMPFITTKKMVLPLEELHAAFANMALRTLIGGYGGKGIRPSAPLALKTLALGALTYRDIRNGLGCHICPNQSLYEFLRLQIYKVDCKYQCEGQPRPLAVHTETGTYERTEAAGGDVNIFKPYWLG